MRKGTTANWSQRYSRNPWPGCFTCPMLGARDFFGERSCEAGMVYFSRECSLKAIYKKRGYGNPKNDEV